MTDMNKINEQELENAAGGYGYDSGWRTVMGIQSGYLAIRTAPAADYNNEINHIGLHNGDKVQITGSYVQGANVKHFFTLLGNEFFTSFGKQFFTLSGKEIFTL